MRQDICDQLQHSGLLFQRLPSASRPLEKLLHIILPLLQLHVLGQFPSVANPTNVLGDRISAANKRLATAGTNNVAVFDSE